MVDGLWGGGENSCREPVSQVRRLYGARPLPSAVSMASTSTLPFERRLGTSHILDLRGRHLAARLHERHRADTRRRQPPARRGLAAPATDWCPCYARIGLWGAEEGGSKRSRTPDPGGHGGGWRVACGGVPRGFRPYALRQYLPCGLWTADCMDRGCKLLCKRDWLKKFGSRRTHDSPAISPPPYCTEFEYGDFLAPGPRRQYVVVLRNGPLRGRCYYLTGLYLLFICPTCLVIALELQ